MNSRTIFSPHGLLRVKHGSYLFQNSTDLKGEIYVLSAIFDYTSAEDPDDDNANAYYGTEVLRSYQLSCHGCSYYRSGSDIYHCDHTFCRWYDLGGVELCSKTRYPLSKYGTNINVGGLSWP